MALIIELSKEVEERLNSESRRNGVESTEIARKLIEGAFPDDCIRSDASVLEERHARNQRAIEMLNRWVDEGDEEEQRESLEALKKGLNARYSSNRVIFP